MTDSTDIIPPEAERSVPLEELDPTLVWLLRRMIDAWGALGVKKAVDTLTERRLMKGPGPRGTLHRERLLPQGGRHSCQEMGCQPAAGGTVINEKGTQDA